MASSYSTRLRLELMATGEKSSIWGSTHNSAVTSLIDEAISGYVEVAVGGGIDVTLTTNNGSSDEARNAVIKLTGTLTANINVIVPTVEWTGVIWNATSGAYTVTVKPTAGSGVTVVQGGIVPLFCDGSDVYQAANLAGVGISSFTSDVSMTGDLTVTTGDITVTDTTADALEGPLVTLHRDSASPADDDVLGAIVFDGEDDGSTQTTYAKIKGVAKDVTNSSEDGELAFDTVVAGTLSTAMNVGAGLYMNGATGGDKGADTINVKEGGLYFDGVQYTDVIVVSVTDEDEALAAGTAAITFRMPFAMTLTGVRASLVTAQTSGSVVTIDINEGGTTVISTKLTIDNTEKTSTTAATAAVISDSALADDAEITIDIDQIGNGTAEGLKVTLIGTRS